MDMYGYYLYIYIYNYIHVWYIYIAIHIHTYSHLRNVTYNVRYVPSQPLTFPGMHIQS